jgi:hypothetical protein
MEGEMPHDENWDFDDFCQMMLSMPPSDDLAIGALQNKIRSGEGEAEVVSWIAAHIWDFPDGLRQRLVMTFATRSLAEAGEKARSQKATKSTEVDRSDWRAKVMERVAEEQPPRTLREYERRYRELHAEGGIALAWPYAMKYGHGRNLPY